MYLSGGMFSVSGAGTFLSEVVRNSYEANVETKYKTTPISQRISDINIGKTYPEECQSDRYTHIVSGVTLGLEAYMTFKFEAQKESDANQVAGDMEIIVKNIPNFSVSGQGTLDLSQSQQEIINKTVIKMILMQNQRLLSWLFCSSSSGVPPLAASLLTRRKR